MALNKIALENGLKTMFQELLAFDGSPGQEQSDSVDKFAADTANLLDTFVKSGTISTTVTVTSVSGVTPGAGISGPGTGTGTGTIA